MKSIVAIMVMAIVATSSFSACSDDDSPSFNPDYAVSRTVMVYMVAENSMSGTAVRNDLNEMLGGFAGKGFYPDDRVVVYVDDVNMPRIYMMDRNTTAASWSDLQPVWASDEDVNSASADQLDAFVKYVKKMYPADSYGLVMWSHGSGWIPSTYAEDEGGVEAARRAFGVDNGKNLNSSDEHVNVGSQMNVHDMARVLEERGGVDFILFDACFMQNVEVAYELRNATKYILASPAEIPGPGADYSTMTPAMFRKEDYAEQMLEAYYNRYRDENDTYNIVISCVRTSALADFVAYMRQVLVLHREDLLAADYGDVQDYFLYDEWSELFPVDMRGKMFPDFYDMQGAMRKVLSDEEFAAWKSEVSKVVTCLHTDRWYSVYERGKLDIDGKQCCGMSMFVPMAKYDAYASGFNQSFLDTAWARDVAFNGQ